MSYKQLFVRIDFEILTNLCKNSPTIFTYKLCSITTRHDFWCHNVMILC